MGDASSVEVDQLVDTLVNNFNILADEVKLLNKKNIALGEKVLFARLKVGPNCANIRLEKPPLPNDDKTFTISSRDDAPHTSTCFYRFLPDLDLPFTSRYPVTHHIPTIANCFMIFSTRNLPINMK